MKLKRDVPEPDKGTEPAEPVPALVRQRQPTQAASDVGEQRIALAVQIEMMAGEQPACELAGRVLASGGEALLADDRIRCAGVDHRAGGRPAAAGRSSRMTLNSTASPSRNLS